MIKNIIAPLFIILFSCTSFAQSWFDIGVKGGYGPTFIVNNNVWNDKNISSIISYGNMYGGKLGFNFNEFHELTFDGTASSLNQSFTIKSSDSLTYDKEIGFSTFDMALLYRHHSNGGYFEIGPQYSMVKNAEESISLSTSENTNAKTNYTSSYYAAVFGFGASLMGSDNFSFMLGCRMTYGLNDLISETGGKSQNYSYPMNDAYYNPQYASYKDTKPFSIMVVAELNFDVGFFANSTCGKGRTKFITF